MYFAHEKVDRILSEDVLDINALLGKHSNANWHSKQTSFITFIQFLFFYFFLIVTLLTGFFFFSSDELRFQINRRYEIGFEFDLFVRKITQKISTTK